ncbi:DUF3147 family protein [Leptospira levettii]|uniref:DUF3147 family protein n=1 Tax=Leptospira levettii TaxID=2023178 RepID=UPI000C2A8E0C|nr:DUF3147 family protein [Leptospira levettii]PKA27148.1 hypothetical protein CH381_06670 [Leptospira sp. mixed culture ATI2-C-A1]TGM24847.1 DUF3147 family protein [Leptospira levettii]TGM29868.1 DUF3147 family protein [Leptospira levettii]TGM75759.1 DUF3147 family protein [Leptospira levettii]TGM84760.1 DUF3147 family protein [Leptospira levettii]
MVYIIFKYAITAALVVIISEIAKRNDRLGSLIASLPLVTILTLIWLHVESASTEKISNHAYYTFWFVIPTLPLFLVFPKLNAMFGFWVSISSSIVITIILFYLFQILLSRFGIQLFP